MRSASTTMKIMRKTLFSLLFLLPLFCFSQINSPYSRYGVGNLNDQATIANRGMGGISAAMTDMASLNTINPASYGNLYYTNLDLGLEFLSTNLKSKNPVGNFKSNYMVFNSLSLGFPFLSSNKKALQKERGWGMAIGLKPISRINYKINTTEGIVGDSAVKIYEGSGGVNEAFIGTGVKLKNFSFGFNTGYLFGEKDYSTRIGFTNDTIDYYKANYETTTHFGGMFLDAGIQYQIPLKKGALRLGAYSQLKSSHTGRQEEIRETFIYDANGATVPVDTVLFTSEVKGKVVLPATYGFGFVYEAAHILVGADYEFSKWSDYRFFGQQDNVQNNWKARVGLQYYPASLNSTGYFNFVKYRAGLSLGRDYIKVDNNLPVFNVSLGGAFPMRLKRSFYDNQFSVINLTLEYGSRGNSKNNLTENTFKISAGFSLSDIWFHRQKYQ